MNINDESQKRKCTGCQLCGAVCPVGAISISLDKYGFYRPEIDEVKCIDCGICVKNCYKFDADIAQTEKLKEKLLYSAWAKEDNIVAATTSGGIADVLVSKLIGLEYKCIGIKYDTESNCAIAKIASNLEEAKAFRGSKYIQAFTVDSFKEFVRNHKNEKFAIFGLPCHIYALNKFLNGQGLKHNHILIDLYCHGCPSMNLWKKYVQEILVKKNCKKVISATFRSKVRGWGNYSAFIEAEGVGRTVRYVSPRIRDPFYTLFFSDLILNGSCYDCKLRSTLEYADIRLGDFWGNKFINNRKGVSAITICTEKGEALFQEIYSDIEYEKQCFSSFLQFQSYGKEYVYDTELRKELLTNLADSRIRLNSIVKFYLKRLPLKNRVVFEGKNIVKLLPDGIVSFIKETFYRLRKI